MLNAGDPAAAARAAGAGLRAARASGSRRMLAAALATCGAVARRAPDKMLEAALGRGEGRVRLPAARHRLGLAYFEAAVAMCDAAGLGGANCTKAWVTEAAARASLADCLVALSEARPRVVALRRQAVALARRALARRALHSEPGAAGVARFLVERLSELGAALGDAGAATEAEACLREALAMGEGAGDVLHTLRAVRRLINLGGHGVAVGPAEAEALRARLNQLLAQLGRSVETDCPICLAPLAPLALAPPAPDRVHVLSCNHQFHAGCLRAWNAATLKGACPVCNKSTP